MPTRLGADVLVATKWAYRAPFPYSLIARQAAHQSDAITIPRGGSLDHLEASHCGSSHTKHPWKVGKWPNMTVSARFQAHRHLETKKLEVSLGMSVLTFYGECDGGIDVQRGAPEDSQRSSIVHDRGAKPEETQSASQCTTEKSTR